MPSDNKASHWHFKPDSGLLVIRPFPRWSQWLASIANFCDCAWPEFPLQCAQLIYLYCKENGTRLHYDDNGDNKPFCRITWPHVLHAHVSCVRKENSQRHNEDMNFFFRRHKSSICDHLLAVLLVNAVIFKQIEDLWKWTCFWKIAFLLIYYFSFSYSL